ncbi:MAG: hypothetical protein ACMG57_02275 [Candidatus Dojkabacteria bacterium]
MRKLWDKISSFFKFLLRKFKSLLRRLDGRKQIAIVWLIVLVSTSTFTFYVFSLTNAKLEYKNAISVFNLSDSDVIYQQGDQIYNLPIFESHYQISTSNEKVTISKSDLKKEEKELSFEQNKSKLYIYVASEDNRYCFVSADVTNLYYDTGSLDSEPEAVTQITTNANPILEANLDWNKYDYVFPGRYFPSQINYNSDGKKLIGYYPIECKTITDSKAVADIITFYKTFRSEVERELLQNELDKLK